MKTTLFIPTWNEIECMKVIMPRINPDWVDQILIVDGGSTDGTIEWAREHGYNVYVQKKPGLRYAQLEALPMIEGDVLIAFSPDGNSIPELIPDLVEKMKEGYDMVIVSRYLDDATSEDDDLITGFGNWMFTRIINLLFGGNYTDTLVIFRGIRKDAIYKMEIDKAPGFRVSEKILRVNVSWEPMLSIRAVTRNLKVGEIPGSEPARIGDERKMRIFHWGSVIVYQIVREFIVETGRKLSGRKASKSL